MTQKRYRIGEVEKLIGVPRSTIRFYIQKGYLSIDKDESNGYRYFSRSDMREILHLVIGRTNLRLDLSQSHRRTTAKSLGEFSALFYTQEEMLLERMAKDRRSVEVLQIYHRMLNRIQRYENRFTILEQGKFYLFPEEFLFQAYTDVIDAGFATSVFEEKEQEVFCKKICSLVFAQDYHLITPKDAEQVETTVAPERYLYTVIKSSLEMEDPSLLWSTLDYCEKQGIKIKPPYYVCYLFQVEEAGEKQYYYDMYLPLDHENTEKAVIPED